MASHMDYMHGTFPKSMNHEKSNPQHEHNLTHEDPHLRGRTEPHSVAGGGVGTLQSGHGNRGTI